MKKLMMFFSLIFILAGCGQEGNQTEDTSQVSLSVREIQVVEENLTVHVSGEARSSEDYFYYTVEQGSELIIPEQAISTASNSEEWHMFEFEVTLEEAQLDDEDVPYITFYVKDDDEQMVNSNFVPLDIKDS